MNRLYFSPSARDDLKAILDYVARQNPSAAKGLWKKLKDTCRHIARFPEIGAFRADLAPGLRSLPTGNYVVFYRVAEGRVDVVRVLHAARDYSRIVG